MYCGMRELVFPNSNSRGNHIDYFLIDLAFVYECKVNRKMV